MTADESKTDELLKKLDFESKDELEKRIKKLKIKLGMITKESLVRRIYSKKKERDLIKFVKF